MVDVDVEAHADGVGGDQIVDVAGLVERHLRVAGARRQRAQHHGGAAALAADQFGDGIDLSAEKATMAERRGSRVSFFCAGIGQLGEARAA